MGEMGALIITEYHRQQNSYNSMYQESSLLPQLFFILITIISDLLQVNLPSCALLLGPTEDVQGAVVEVAD